MVERSSFKEGQIELDAMSVEEAKPAFNQLVTRLSAGKANPRIIVKISETIRQAIYWNDFDKTVIMGIGRYVFERSADAEM